MSATVLTLHILVALAMIVLVLLQRSEGGALGIGGGSDNFMSSRGLGNALTRATAILAAIFFATSITLAVLGTMEARRSVFDGEDAGKEIIIPAPLLLEEEVPSSLPTPQ